MRNPEQAGPSKIGAGGHEQSEKDVLNQFALEKLSELAQEKAGPRISEKERDKMTSRLNELNKEIPKFAEELNIIDHSLGAVDVSNDKSADGAIVGMSQEEAGVAEPEVAAPKLTPEEFENLSAARTTLIQKIQELEYERGNTEKVLFPDDYQELKDTRQELGLSSPGIDLLISGTARYFRHPGGRVGAFPAAPEQPTAALTPTPKKTGLIAKLKGLFGG